jgi:hypothetical protein
MVDAFAARVAPGAQLVMFHLVATYVGGGSAHVGELVIRVNTIGKHGVSYDVISDDCRASVPGTDLIRVTDRVFFWSDGWGQCLLPSCEK